MMTDLPGTRAGSFRRDPAAGPGGVGGTRRPCEVLVLGGGTGGSAAAAAARRAGAQVAMFNDDELGGLCILRGCMPTKTLLHAAHLAHRAAHPVTAGIHVGGVEVDFAAVMANKDAKVERFKRAKIAGIEKAGYDVIQASARFTGPDTVEAGGETYRFTRGAVIATGSAPVVPPLPGIDEVAFLTSDDVMRLTRRPDSAVAIGTGAVGLELSQFLARMGTRVTLVSRRRVLSGIDPLLADEMEKVLEGEPNLVLIQPVRPERVSRGEGKVRVWLEGGRSVEAEALVVATGRRALLEELGLEAAGVEVAEGRVVCGADMRTSNPRVFVAGDASGEEMILHIASQEGHVAGVNAAGADPAESVDRRLAMRVVFTDPPLATLGLTETQARDKGIPVIPAHVFFPETGRAITQDVRYGLCKFVAEADRGEILGAQILGPRADDLVHTLAALMHYRGTAADMLAMPWYHPTLSEVFLSLAREIEGKRRSSQAGA
ncbi:MAG: dihydrolipoyl dehydrogenase family protein [Acidobacteriota bacterium]